MAVAQASGSNSTAVVSPWTRAAIYVRISPRPNKDGLGVKRQERECRELCQKLGLTVVAVFEDDDRSAYTGKPRPGYIAMLERLELGDFGAIVAWHPDRLHRSPVELEEFIDVVDRCKTMVFTVKSGDYDLSTAGGRMTARVVGAVARHESEHKSERIKSKYRELIEAAKPVGVGGSRAYGHEAHEKGATVCHVRPDEADIVRDMVSRTLAGESISGLVKDLNARKVPTVSGAAWRTCTIRQILRSPRIAGMREYEGKLVPAHWESIIDADEYLRLRARLDGNAQAHRRAPRRFALTGLMVCGHCKKPALAGKTVRKWPSTDTEARYVCSKERGGCGRISVLAVPVEDRVKDALFDVVDSPDFARRVSRSDGQPAELHDQLEKLERRMEELAETYGAGEITKKEWIAARAPLEKKLRKFREESERRTEDHARSSVLDRWIDGERSLAEDWDRLRLDQQRAIIAAVFEPIIIAPAAANGARRFDSKRVTVERRF